MNSIAYFPTPLPNEDFRSVLYRYHLCSLNPEITDTNKELFNARSEFTVFPRALEVLLRKLPPSQNLTVETIVEKHTLLPAFFPFISESRKEEILHDIKQGGSLEDSCVGKLVGNKYGKCISDMIKYCPCCIEEDMRKYGCSYIHREHQFAFLHSCNMHSVDLITHCDVCRVELKCSPIEGKCINGHKIMNCGTERIDDLEKELHKDLDYLNNNSDRIKAWLIKQRYFEYLDKEGYIESNGKEFRNKLLIGDFINTYTPAQFMQLGLDVEYIKKGNAIERILRGVRDPLVINLPLTLIIIRFLAGSLERFISKEEPYICEIPYAKGPWICINTRCPYYNQKKVIKCIRTPNSYGGLSCKFICEHCKAGYVKVWSWSTGEKEVVRHNIIYPPIKVAEIIQHLREGRSFNQLADELFCSLEHLRKVINKHYKAEHNEPLLAHCEVAASSEISPEHNKKNSYRERIQQTIKLNPKLSRNHINLKNTTAYRWLQKNDSAWLEEQLSPSKSYNRFDWKEVDEALTIRVREISKQLIEANPKTRVSKYMIMGALSKTENGRLKNYIQYLPKSNRALLECSETKEQYQHRYLPMVVWQLKTYYNYKEITMDTVQAYRRSYRGITEEFKRILIKRLTDLNEY